MRVTLCHPAASVNGQPKENVFYAYEKGTSRIVCSCIIYGSDKSEMFPRQPWRLRLDLEGEPVPDSLLGAALARSHEICAAQKVGARVFTVCPPENDELLAQLLTMGFQDNDGLVLMRMSLNDARSYRPIPGAAVVRDTLSDAREQKYFLSRYNKLYNTACDQEWLENFIDRPGFQRILLTSAGGLVGEILTWEQGGSGVIGFVQTSKSWRNKGVASCLVGMACEEFEINGLRYAEATVHARIPWVLRLLEGAGFQQSVLLMRYPGIDILPQNIGESDEDADS